MDVVEGILEMPAVANEAIEVVPIPEGAMPVKQAIGSVCRKGFPGMNDAAQRESRIHLDQHVHVIGHDDPGVKSIAAVVEVEQRVFNGSRYRSVRKEAVTVTGIEKSIKSFEISHVAIIYCLG